MAMENIVVSNSREYFEFINSISSEQTKKAYKQNLTRFMKFCKLDSFDELLKIDMQKAIIDYIVTLKEDDISYATVHVLLAPIYHFCEMADIVIKKRKIRKFMGEKKKVVKDRPYTNDEILKLLNIADIRMKVAILLMASSGVRVGSIPSLQIKHLQKVTDNIYRLNVYENDSDEYVTFTSPESTKAIDAYLEYRTRNGEELTNESYLIRKQFDMNDLEKVKKSVEPIQTGSLRALINNLVIKAGLRQTSHSTKRERKGIALTHGFRKFFTNQLIETNVKTEIRWLLEGHKLKGNDSSYVRITEKQLLEEYMKAIPLLTLSNEEKLKVQLEEKIQIEKTQMEIMQQDLNKFKKELAAMKKTRRK